MKVEDIKSELFGCVQLPFPSSCFGISECQYGVKNRELLIKYISNERTQTMPWPPALKACFSGHVATTLKIKPPSQQSSSFKWKEHCQSCKDENDLLLYGSPMLDNALGAMSSLGFAVKELTKHDENDSFSIKHSARQKSAGNAASDKCDEDDTQFDEILPPEQPTNWVQCDLCRKWRRVAWHIDADSLPDDWICAKNTWEPESACCKIPQDVWDPAKESTIESKSMGADKDFTIGTWRDVYCTRNEYHYEAQIRDIKLSNVDGGCSTIKFHFKGWASKFDEWIESDSERIQPHNLYTDATSQCPRAQERWQGKKKSSQNKQSTNSKKRK